MRPSRYTETILEVLAQLYAVARGPITAGRCLQPVGVPATRRPMSFWSLLHLRAVNRANCVLFGACATTSVMWPVAGSCELCAPYSSVVCSVYSSRCACLV
jgi:hypothetical protein